MRLSKAPVYQSHKCDGLVTTDTDDSGDDIRIKQTWEIAKPAVRDDIYVR